VTDARSAYRSRQAVHHATAVAFEARLSRIGLARLVAFLALLGLAWAVVTGNRIPAISLALPAGAFAWLVAWHARTHRARARARSAERFHANRLARLDQSWAGRGRDGVAWTQPGHPYAADLDLFGSGSLFELLSEARTLAGERTLARWLQEPAGPAMVGLRQKAVRELAGRLEFRESLAVLGDEARDRLDERPLLRWAAELQVVFPAATPVVCGLAVVALVVAVGGAIQGAWPGWVALIPLAAVVGLGAALRSRVQATVAGIGTVVRELGVLAQLIERLETEPVVSPLLLELRTRLGAAGRPASWQVWRLRRLLGLLEMRGNQLVMLVLPLLMWTTQVAWAISRWRREVGPAIGEWVAAVGEYEALASLAGQAFDHPEDAYPSFEVDAGFRAEGLGHPLLVDGGVRNSVSLGGELRLLVISGSNMSGKSTLLRSIGTAVVMAQMGAPVRASRLVLEPLNVGASIATHDSLQEGSSRFYAEITRLRQVLELTRGDRTVLFLLDELLSGTNSHDRRLGAEAVVRSLLDRGAIGILTTHDLALAQVAGSLAPRAANVHFQDDLQDGQITFDYRMRPGVVERSNALALMRSVGLEV